MTENEVRQTVSANDGGVFEIKLNQAFKDLMGTDTVKWRLGIGPCNMVCYEHNLRKKPTIPCFFEILGLKFIRK